MLEAIFGTFTEVGEWITEFLPTLLTLFWNNETQTLTFLGVLAVAGLAISVFFLLMGIIQNFLHFRG